MKDDVIPVIECHETTQAQEPPAKQSTNRRPIPLHLLDASPSWESVSTFFLSHIPILPSTSSSTHKLVQEILQETPIDQPDATYTFHLLIALFLTTILAYFSALDAKNQCASIDGYIDQQQQQQDPSFYDDDFWANASLNSFWERLQEKHNCLQMFRWVVIPVTAVTCTTTSVAILFIRCHRPHPDPRDIVAARRHHLHQCLRLCALLPLVLLAWSYGIIAIMLSPRDTTEGENPYRSLAAVDHMGHIGQNANLYYFSWISIGLSVAVVYQIGVDTIRQYQRYHAERLMGSESVGDVEAMLSSLTVMQLETFRETRATWYQSLYRLRIRTGIWTAALLSSLVVMTSSVHIWRAVLIPTAKTYAGTVRFRHVCEALQGASEIPPELCVRTAFSLFSGMLAALLCIGALLMHVAARTGAAKVVDTKMRIKSNSSKFGGTHIPLRNELILAIALSNLLGLNAACATGVQGPAATVGNLYYASWIGFLLCLRISLGCLEELANLEDEEGGKQGNKAFDDIISMDEEERSKKSESSRTSGIVPESTTDLLENDRAQRTRMYMSLTICTTVCSASALDAAMNQSHTVVMSQLFVMYAPSAAAVICACQFLLCLKSRSYLIVSRLWFGGVLSVVTFGICMASLVLTMHSESSWAVDKIGDIEIANLYYFTWASIIIAGLQMASYMNSFFGKSQKDYVTVVWLAICKVCFVLLGAGYHVWHTISDTCTVENIHLYTVTFCSKTLFAISISLIGMFVAGSVALTRILMTMFWPTFSIKIRCYVEMIVSFIMMLLFGMAVVLITGIGGPGQSVGDMYYSTWLCFFVTIGLVLVCLEQIRQVDGGKTVAVPQENEATEMTTMSYHPPTPSVRPPRRPGRPPLPSLSRNYPCRKPILIVMPAVVPCEVGTRDYDYRHMN